MSTYAVAELVLTKREYFAAHAPVEPQAWFKPVMPEKPTIPSCPHELLDQWHRLGDYLRDEEVDPRVLKFKEQYWAAYKATEIWEREQIKQSYIQWPHAWADAVLASAAEGGAYRLRSTIAKAIAEAESKP